MGRLILAVWLALALLISSPIWAQEKEEEPADPAKLKEQIRKRIEDETTPLPQLGELEMNDVVSLRVENGQIVAFTRIKQTAGKQLLKIKGIDAVITLMVRPADDVLPAPQPGKVELIEAHPADILQFEYHDLSRSDVLANHISVACSPGYLQITCETEGVGRDTIMQLVQSRQQVGALPTEVEQKVSFYVQEIQNEQTIADMKAHVPTIADLRAQYPTETTKYLQPALAALWQEGAIFSVDSRAAWQVLASRFQPDQATRQRVDAIVKKLDAENFQERQDAFHELEKLGQAAALLLMRQDRSGLSLEQNSQIDAFLVPYQPLTKEKAEELSRSIPFMLDCLYSDDREIRGNAVAQLQELTGKKIAFAESPTVSDRAAAINKLREQLISPASKPSQGQTQ